MTLKRSDIALIAGTSTLALVVLVVWVITVPAREIKVRLAEEEPAAEKTTAEPEESPTGQLVKGAGEPAGMPGRWTQFRGGDRSNVVHEAPNLARSWPEGGLSVVWDREVGAGHAGAAVLDGKVYLADYDLDNHRDVVRCLSLADGEAIWSRSYRSKVKRIHGSSRTVPAVTEDYVVAIGPKADVYCLDSQTGEQIWRMDLVEEFGTEVPPWYAGQCPLIEGDRVILAPGGEPMMMAVELASGNILWETPNPGDWGMTHSSITPMDYGDGRQYIYCTTQGVVGVSASDGALLWTEPRWKIALATVPSPLVVDESRVFLSGGYDSGAMMLRLSGEGADIKTEIEFKLGPEVFGAEQQTPILYEGHIYGIIPSGELACLNLEGERLWTSGKTTRFELGPLLIADGLILALHGQEGVLHMVKAVAESYQPLEKLPVIEGHDIWGPMAMVGDLLLLRDVDTLKCLRLPIEQQAAVRWTTEKSR